LYIIFSPSTASQMACPKSKTCSYRAALGLGNKYVRLNVGGTLFYTTLQVLTRQDSVLKAMFSGRKEVLIDREVRAGTITVITDDYGFKWK
uniref:Tumor necrosis factor, alpha-induced protein 1 (endothelial) n=1 Tax=Oncorhynchus mykiss TaxID=8022 RepID=A0A8K9ULS1_ONCMY